MAKTKKCTKCLKIKPVSEFHTDRSRKDGLRYWCKPCNINNIKQWTQKNPAYVKRLQRNNDLKRYYGITLEQYEGMKAKQNDKCAICHKSNKLVVDHCHVSGTVRELLCHRCNRVLGIVEEDEILLRSLAEYIKKHKGL